VKQRCQDAKPVEIRRVPQTPEPISAASEPKFTILWGHRHLLNTASEVRDLGVIVDSKLFDKHISLIVRKAQPQAGLILKCFCSRDRDLLMKAFCTYVRPLLEYSTRVWSPHYQYLILKIENVQRAYTKRLTGMNNLNYRPIWSVLRLSGFRLLSDGG